MLATSGLQKDRLGKFVTDDTIALLLHVLQSSAAFSALAPDNMKLANKLRSAFVKIIGEVKGGRK